MSEKKSKIPPGYEIQVYYETNPWTNIRYRRERLVPIIDINATPEFPVQPDLLTAEQLAAKQRAEREKVFQQHQADRPDLYPSEN